MKLQIKLPPEFKASWLAALRSGDYIQGRSALKRANGSMCCLGVACDLAHKADTEPFWDGTTIASGDEIYLTRNGNHMFPYENDLPAPIFSALTQKVDGESSDSVMSYLAEHNDSAGDEHWSFPQIADWVETNL